MVTKRKDWYKIISIFGGVKIWEIDDYFVFMMAKKDDSYANANHKKSKGNKRYKNKDKHI